MKNTKNYKINNTAMTITADLKKLTADELEEVKTYIALGFKFQHRYSRDGSKRSVDYYKNNLIAVDCEIFDALRSEKDKNGKTRKGAYIAASRFATTIIKLGQYVDDHPEDEGILDEYRNLTMEDQVKAKLFARDYLAA